MDSVDTWDLFATSTQGIVKTHGPALCHGRYCCIHNPSDHHMRGWPLLFDHRKMSLALRACDHGFAHPDPDSMAYFQKCRQHPNVILWLASHECDGCCLSEGEEGYIVETF